MASPPQAQHSPSIPTGHSRSDGLAFALWLLSGISGAFKYSALHVVGKTPPTQPFSQGCGVAFVSSATDRLALHQRRKAFAFALNKLQSKVGLGTPELRAQWATPVHDHKLAESRQDNVDDRGAQGHAWKAYWIPFQDQAHDAKEEQSQQHAKKVDVSKVDIGNNCDLVVLYAHGGGFIDGYPLQSLDTLRRVMKRAHKEHNLKIGFLTMDYGLSPEIPFPGALDECLDAYRSLIKEFNIDPKRIVFGGESAGGNLMISLALKLRDEFQSELELPLGTFTVSPFFPGSEPLKHTLFDTLTPRGCRLMKECYSQGRPEVLTSPYFSPLNATSFRGLPPMLVFVGGTEILRHSIETFVKRARDEDGVETRMILKEDRSHIWFLIDNASTEQDRNQADQAIAEFLANLISKRPIA
ncbi:Alpha/Beta hydrolase protein [Mortierella sp. GBAus27b]|nr:Alpha/Beta hydrolase protein [Mortierella sp. GBAus27b]